MANPFLRVAWASFAIAMAIAVGPAAAYLLDVDPGLSGAEVAEVCNNSPLGTNHACADLRPVSWDCQFEIGGNLCHIKWRLDGEASSNLLLPLETGTGAFSDGFTPAPCNSGLGSSCFIPSQDHTSDYHLGFCEGRTVEERFAMTATGVLGDPATAVAPASQFIQAGC